MQGCRMKVKYRKEKIMTEGLLPHADRGTLLP